MSAILAPLFSFLTCLEKAAAGLIAFALSGLVNLFVLALMSLLGPLLALLPDVTLPTIALPSSIAEANWIFPLDQFVIALGVVATVLGAWHLVAIGLRW